MRDRYHLDTFGVASIDDKIGESSEQMAARVVDVGRTELGISTDGIYRGIELCYEPISCCDAPLAIPPMCGACFRNRERIDLDA